MSPTPFFTVLCLKKSTWSNPGDLYILFFQIMCVDCTNPHMDSNRHRGLGSIGYHSVFLIWNSLPLLWIPLFRYHKSVVHIFLLVYVDDITLTGTNSWVLASLIKWLHFEFALKDLGPLGYFLRIQVTWDSSSPEQIHPGCPSSCLYDC